MQRRDFLKYTAGGSLLALTPLQAHGADVSLRYGFLRGGRWRNWSHQVQATPKAIVRPRDITELQAAVTQATRIRAVGAAHSISGIVPTEDTLLDTSELAGILSVDRDRLEVTVRAGTRLLAFSNALAEMGYALPSTGDTFYQSLAGLLSTGTHGTGMKWGSCSDEESLVGMELVLADGTIRELRGDRPGDVELMQAARVGLGALGIVSTVTLRVVPLHNLDHVGRKVSFEEAIDPEHYLTNDHYEFAYFPYCDQAYAFFRNITQSKPTENPFSRWFRESLTENTLARALLKAASLDPASIPTVTQGFLKLVPNAHLIDRCDQVMTIERKVPSYLMEFALPIDQAAEAMRSFRDLTLDFARRPRGERFFVSLPAQVRFIRGDRGTLLSPGEGRDTCWFGVGSYIAFKGSEPFFREMESRLLALGGKPHWGKLFYRNPRALYEGFDRYDAIRRGLDPQGKFENRYITQLCAGSVGAGQF